MRFFGSSAWCHVEHSVLDVAGMLIRAATGNLCIIRAACKHIKATSPAAALNSIRLLTRVGPARVVKAGAVRLQAMEDDKQAAQPQAKGAVKRGCLACKHKEWPPPPCMLMRVLD